MSMDAINIEIPVPGSAALRMELTQGKGTQESSATICIALVEAADRVDENAWYRRAFTLPGDAVNPLRRALSAVSHELARPRIGRTGPQPYAKGRDGGHLIAGMPTLTVDASVPSPDYGPIRVGLSYPTCEDAGAVWIKLLRSFDDPEVEQWRSFRAIPCELLDPILTGLRILAPHLCAGGA